MNEMIHPLRGQIAAFLKEAAPKYRNFFEDWLESYFLYKLVEKKIFGDITHARHFSQQVGQLFQPSFDFELPPEIKNDERCATMQEFHEAIFNKTLSETLFAVEKLLKKVCGTEAFDFRKELGGAIESAAKEFGIGEGKTDVEAAKKGGGRVIEVDFKRRKRK